MKTFGSRLRALRETRNWSQESLGFELGVSKATVSKWEGGSVLPGFEMLLRIKRLFADQGVSLDFLGEGVSQPGSGESTAARIGEPAATYPADPARARSANELDLLMRFRTLTRRQQEGLLRLLGE